MSKDNEIVLTSKYKKTYLIFFIATIIYSFYGVIQISKGGGPCNAGIEFFILGPAIFFCTLLLFFSGILDLNTPINGKKNNVSVMTCLLSLLVWTLCLFQNDESLLRKTLFLGPFEVLNLVSLMIAVKLQEPSSV